MNKKIRKQAVDLTDLAVGIVVLGIVVSIGVLIITSVRDNRLTDATIVTTGNETTTSVAKVTNLDNVWFNSVFEATNATDGTVISSGNYTTSTSAGGTGQVTFATASTFNETPVNFSYTWYNTSTRVDWTLADNASTGLAEYGNWFDIIVIVGVAAVVLSLIFMAFGRRDVAGSGVSY